MYALLICSYLVLQVEHHLCVTEDSKWGEKHYFFFVVSVEADLVITRIGI
jgi:hypothetical protein